MRAPIRRTHVLIINNLRTCGLDMGLIDAVLFDKTTLELCDRVCGYAGIVRTGCVEMTNPKILIYDMCHNLFMNSPNGCIILSKWEYDHRRKRA